MKAISTNPQTLHVKRTSLWNKANEELKKHQLLVEKVKEKREDFYNEPYGDPFASEDMRCVWSLHPNRKAHLSPPVSASTLLKAGSRVVFNPVFHADHGGMPAVPETGLCGGREAFKGRI